MKIKVRTCYQVSRLCVNYFRHQKVGVHSPSRIGRWHRLPQKLPYACRFHDEIFQTELENSWCIHWRFHDDLKHVAWTFGPPVCLGGFGYCKLDPCRSHRQLLFCLEGFWTWVHSELESSSDPDHPEANEDLRSRQVGSHRSKFQAHR